MSEKLSPERRNNRKREGSVDRSAPLDKRKAGQYEEAIMGAYDRQFGAEATESRRAMVREIAQAFFTEVLRSARLGRSEKYKIAYPWGTANTETIAKKLYEHATGTSIGPLRPREEITKKREFIFGSLIFRMHGTPFIYHEEAVYQLIRHLPAAFQAIEKGEEPESFELNMVGSPTNSLGVMSSQCLDEIKKKGAFKTFGEFYADEIAAILAEDTGRPASVRLCGTSIGAAIAIEVARELLDRQAVTQDRDVQKPRLQIRIDAAPATSSPFGLEPLQTGLKFAVNGILAKRDEYTNAAWSNEAQFVHDVNSLLAERKENPIRETTSPEQTQMKQQGLRSLVAGLLQGQKMPDMNVTEVVGFYDPLLTSPGFVGKALLQRATRKNSLQRYRVSQEGKRKRYGIAMGHQTPHYRENVLRRLDHAAALMERAKSRDRTPPPEIL